MSFATDKHTILGLFRTTISALIFKKYTPSSAILITKMTVIFDQNGRCIVKMTGWSASKLYWSQFQYKLGVTSNKEFAILNAFSSSYYFPLITVILVNFPDLSYPSPSLEVTPSLIRKLPYLLKSKMAVIF